MPRAVYKYVGPAQAQGAQPIRVAGGEASFSSDQTTGELLCKDCEQRFNQNGEKATLRACYQSPSSFALASQLASLTPLGREGDIDVYDAGALGSLREALIYFAISIVWRWSVGHHLWPQCTGSPRRLGPYEDALRPYLLGAAPRPESVHVWAQVLEPTMPLNFASFPVGPTSGSPRFYDFWIPGIWFAVPIGGQIDPAIARSALSGTATPTIGYGDPKKLSSFDALSDFVKAAEPQGKFAQRKRA